MRIEYHPAIENELRNIVNHYNECSQGLGDDFLDEFERQIFKVASMPTLWVIVENDIRRALMTRFPYAIYFRVLKDGMLRVTIIKHQRKHPAYGLNRK